MTIEASVRRLPAAPAQFSITITPHTGSRSRVLRVDDHGLITRLREWDLSERTISTILNLPPGTAVSFQVDGAETARENRTQAPLVA